MATLEELEARRAKLEKAAADPAKAVWYDDFKRENRPFSEIEAQLNLVNRDIARLNPSAVRTRRHLPRAVCDL